MIGDPNPSPNPIPSVDPGADRAHVAGVAACFTLYSRSWCHLCEDMLTALRALETPDRRFQIDVVDVDADPLLEARFNELVPVLYGRIDAPELCHYFLDEAAVHAYLGAEAALAPHP